MTFFKVKSDKERTDKVWFYLSEVSRTVKFTELERRIVTFPKEGGA